jgi:hypothetical protein
MQQINVILPVAGADYVGPLPAELQGYVDFAVWEARGEIPRAYSAKPAVISALASGLLYLSHPTLVTRVGTSRSCQCTKSLAR